MKRLFTLNSETLGQIITIGKKHASVMDHVADALSLKFAEHHAILANLFWVKPVEATHGSSASKGSFASWAELDSQARPPSDISRLDMRSLPSGAEQGFVVRFLGDPLNYYEYVVAGRSAICADPNVCPVRRKHNIEPALRHAVNLINRDDAQLYLCELPTPVFLKIAAWSKRRGMNPGGKIAVDFLITVSRAGKYTRYEVDALERSHLSAEEKSLQLYDLKGIFKPTPPDEIEGQLFSGHPTNPHMM